VSAVESACQEKTADAAAAASRAHDERTAAVAALQALTQQHLSEMEAARARELQWERERAWLTDALAAASGAAAASLPQTGGNGVPAAAVADMELRLRRARDAELEALAALAAGTSEWQGKCAALQAEVNAARAAAASADTRGDAEVILQLKNEARLMCRTIETQGQQLATAQADLASAISNAQARVSAAETLAETVAAALSRSTLERDCERLSAEARVSELSALAGRLEEMHEADMATMAASRQRIAELSDQLRGYAEAAAAQAVGGSLPATSSLAEQPGESAATTLLKQQHAAVVHALQEKINRLKALLQAASVAGRRSAAADVSTSYVLPSLPWGRTESAGDSDLCAARQAAESLHATAAAWGERAHALQQQLVAAENRLARAETLVATQKVFAAHLPVELLCADHRLTVRCITDVSRGARRTIPAGGQARGSHFRHAEETGRRRGGGSAGSGLHG
jgi:hypothetical protein